MKEDELNAAFLLLAQINVCVSIIEEGIRAEVRKIQFSLLRCLKLNEQVTLFSDRSRTVEDIR